jgi:plastocyanin
MFTMYSNVNDMTLCGYIGRRIEMKKYLALTISLILASMLLFGCTNSTATKTTSQSTTTSPTTSSSGSAVTISNFAFSPETLPIKVGTKVTWTNNDSVTHTVTSDNGVFNSGSLSPNATFSYTFNSAGTFNYHCSIHTSMKGTIIVQ